MNNVLKTVTMIGLGLTMPFLSSAENEVTKKINISTFKSIEVGSFFEVELVPSNSYSIEVTCDSDLEEKLNVAVKGSTLVVTMKNGVSSNNGLKRAFGKKVPVLRAKVTVPTLDGIELNGSAELTIAGDIKTNRLEIDLSGSSELTMSNVIASEVDIDASGSTSIQSTVQSSTVEVETSGSADVNLVGSANDLIIESSGSSSIKALTLDAKHVTFDLSSASRARVNALETLQGEVSGVSRVNYLDHKNLKKPRIKETGVSTVRPL